MKKMDLAMLPLVFQVGAMSTWMMISAIMSTKSVLIGLALLAFKIAVSSAKLAGFVSKWKNDEHHHEQTSWSSHGYDRGSSFNGPYPEHTSYPSPDSEWRSFYPEWTPNDQDYFPPRQANVNTYRPFSHPVRSYLHADERNTIVDSAMIKRNLLN
ncbi:hypothetical protein O0L34_g13307 [Tuta absoluta]|nr:hypothetical protein O0L34_g13307 [Tuta absoluta]